MKESELIEMKEDIAVIKTDICWIKKQQKDFLDGKQKNIDRKFKIYIILLTAGCSLTVSVGSALLIGVFK